MAFQYVRELLQGVVRVKVGQEAEIATVNADHFDVIARQRARRAEHIAIPADNDGEIRQLTNFRQRAGFYIFQL